MLDIISKITKITKLVIDEANKPESYTKGEDFERYVREKLFPVTKYDLVRKTHDYNTNKKDFVESSKEPDYMFRSKTNKQEFYIEAKYRSNYYENAIEWCKPYQLKRYQEIDKKTPVFVVLAVGKQPASPGEVYVIPIKEVKYTKLYHSFLNKYVSTPGQAVDYRILQLK